MGASAAGWPWWMAAVVFQTGATPQGAAAHRVPGWQGDSKRTEITCFLDGLRAAGWIERHNLLVEGARSRERRRHLALVALELPAFRWR